VSDLSKVPFLANLDPIDLKTLANRMEKRAYEAGDLIYADGVPGEGLCVVESGTVTILTSASCDGEIMAHLPKGSTFGEAALLSDRPRTTAARAASDATILVLTRSAFQAFLTEHPAAGQLVTQTLMQRPPRGPRQLAAELLKPMPLFSGVADDALVALARNLKLAQVCANSFVYSEDDATDAMYFVESGEVSLLSSEATGRGLLAEVGARDFFGEDALLTDQPREIAALTKSAVDLWSLNRDDFDKLAAVHPAAALKLTRGLAGRSERLNRQLLALAAGTMAPVTRPVVQAAPAAVAAAAPVFVRPVAAPRAPVVRQPLMAGLRDWLGNLSLGGKLRLAMISVLLAWLLFVSLPTAIASTLSGTAQAPSISSRGGAVAAQSFRGSAQARGADAAELFAPVAEDVVDATAAPLTAMSELVVVKPVAAVTSAPQAATTVEAAPVAVAAVAQAPQVAATYAVAAGDTLSTIAARFNVDMDVLAEANGINDPSLIRVDDELKIPGGEEQAEIAAKLAAEPRPAPAPVAVAAPAAVAAAAPAAPAEVAKPALPFAWDGRLNGINVNYQQAAVAPGQQYFRLVKALYREPNEPVGANLPGGDQNIYIEVLDESGNRMRGATAIVQNGGTARLLIENKPFPEYGSNFPMYGMLGSYLAYVDGLPSDKVTGMGLPMKHHVSYFLTFQRTTK